MKAYKIIRQEYGKSRNFITPNILSYGKLPATKLHEYAYEISYGRGMSGNTIYGLSVVRLDKNLNSTERLINCSTCQSSLESIEDLLDQIRALIKAGEDISEYEIID